MKANGGELPTREVGMADVDADGDGEENVLIPDDEDEDVEVVESGRHLEVEATSSVRLE